MTASQFAIHTEAFEAVRLAWPTIEKMIDSARAPRLALVSEIWRVAGTPFASAPLLGSHVVATLSEEEFFALPAGPGLAAVDDIAAARAQAGDGGVVVAYLAVASVLVPYHWEPANILGISRLGMSSFMPGSC
jgi:hypothetical protein